MVKVRQYCGIFYKIRSKISILNLKLLYFSLINSHIIYGLEIVGSAFDTYLEPLVMINKKMLRILQNLFWRQLRSFIHCLKLSQFNCYVNLKFSFWFIDLSIVGQVYQQLIMNVFLSIRIFIPIIHEIVILCIWSWWHQALVSVVWNLKEKDSGMKSQNLLDD